jgi:glutaredoxin
MPTPKWKLVVDIGSAPPKPEGKALDKRIPDMLQLLAAHIPTHRNSPFSPYLPGFTALRLLLLKRNRTPEEEDLSSTMIDSYSSYLSSGRNSSDTAWMVARDYMLLTQSSCQHSTIMPQTLQSIQQQQQDRQQQIVQHQESSQQQIVQQSMQQQLIGQVHHAPNQQQQQQQIMVPAVQIQQVHNQFQQKQGIQKQASQIHRTAPGVAQQQNHEAVAPASLSGPAPAPGNPLLNGRAHGQDGLSTLGHFVNHSAPTGQNGIAAYGQLAQQQQQNSLRNDAAIHGMNHNGVPSLQKNQNGVPGV